MVTACKPGMIRKTLRSARHVDLLGRRMRDHVVISRPDTPSRKASLEASLAAEICKQNLTERCVRVAIRADVAACCSDQFTQHLGDTNNVRQEILPLFLQLRRILRPYALSVNARTLAAHFSDDHPAAFRATRKPCLKLAGAEGTEASRIGKSRTWSTDSRMLTMRDPLAGRGPDQ